MPVNFYRKRHGGFSVIELMVAIAILAIIVGIGIPAFQGMMERSRVDAAAESLADSFRYARSEAIARNATGKIVNGGSYKTGWEVKTPDKDDPTKDILLRVYPEFHDQVTISNNTALSFNGRGMLVGDAADDAEKQKYELAYSGAHKRCARVLLSGAVRLSDGACP